jgi:hypothetical protein|tara:strand:+ start:4227 stop:5852 length:1626 start_codon:yes stop_codon:yes gene_type:complete
MKDFIKYFSGLTRNYGVCKTENGFVDQESGKKRYKHEWSSTEIKEKDYQEHLDGKKSIGIQPCTDNATAKFGAIDIDSKAYKEMNYKFYLDIIQDKNLPIIPVLSKSGGLHLYVFTTEPVRAIQIKEFLESVLFLFKLPITTEVFPKQTSLGSNTEGQKINGNFINLPYHGQDRKALNPDGTQMDLERFIKVIELNALTPSQLKDQMDKIVKDELTGGDKEFDDGPPCLAILTKQKMKDGRDRFLFNYMVFAKKKYPDNWRTKVLQAGRNYFEFDQIWTDDHIKTKIKAWDKPTASHTCKQSPINDVCVKGVCLKRKFGVASDKKVRYPSLSALQKIDYKPTPEWYFTVEKPNGETVQVHAKNITKIENQRELRALLMEQAHIVAPILKGNDFHEIQSNLFSKVDTIKPAPGTSPIEVLKKHLEAHIQGPAATRHRAFMTGSVLLEKEFAYFSYDHFYDDLKTKEWKYDSQRTSYFITQIFNGEKKNDKAEFDIRKRFPGKDDTGNYFPAIRGILKIPTFIFETDKEVEETLNFEDQDDIV